MQITFFMCIFLCNILYVAFILFIFFKIGTQELSEAFPILGKVLVCQKMADTNQGQQ